MTEQQDHPIPVEINLHTKTRLLSIRFSDGRNFDLPAEYLRVFSRAAEVRTMQHPETGKESVNIEAIEPQGQYGILIIFDDGHDTSIYSWETLYDLGLNQQKNWAQYLQDLEAYGYERGSPLPGVDVNAPRRVKLLYFAWLAQKLRRETEEVEVPAKVTSVEELMIWLRRHYRDKSFYLEDDLVRITVNKQFAKPFTRIDDQDEVAIVPVSPVPPAPPK